MNHWKLTLSYDGTGFHGWQVQPGLATVQRTLAEAIHSLCGETVLPQGSGRTDAGVHALGQVASFSLAAAIPAGNLRHALNGVLPPSIRVLAADAVGEDFHARHSAVAKTYEYRIFEERRDGSRRICPPFLAPYAWACRWPLDLDRMNEAAQQVCGTHDFTSFTATDLDRATRDGEEAEGRSFVRTIHSSVFTRDPDNGEPATDNALLRYRVTGSGFLHHMVRNLVGTLAEIGCGRLPRDCIPAILEARDRAKAGATAPARGLFLVSVDYPDISL